MQQLVEEQKEKLSLDVSSIMSQKCVRGGENQNIEPALRQQIPGEPAETTGVCEQQNMSLSKRSMEATRLN